MISELWLGIAVIVFYVVVFYVVSALWNDGGIKKNYRMGKCASARIRLTTQEAETESEKSEKHKALNGIMKGVREWLKWLGNGTG